jgi:tetratricopeptide (TPR) repeat protein
MLCDVKCAAERHLAQELHNKGKFVEAAESYLVLYDEFHAPCPGAKMDEILYNLAVELGSAGLHGGALKVYAILAREKSYATSLLAEKALFYMCQVSYGLTEFEEAAGYCEEYAAKYPASKEAPEALEEAVFLRSVIGQQEEAVEDAWLFQKSYAKAKPDEAAKILVEAGMGYVRAEQWPQAILHFGKLLKALKGPETAGLRLRADVEVGAAYWSLKSYAKAEKLFEAAVEIYEQLSKQEDGGAAASDGAVREAAARAYFYLGEIQFQELEKIVFPRFKPGIIGGEAKKLSAGETKKEFEKVNTWFEKKLIPIINKKLALLEKAGARYSKVISMPSTGWSIAATARRAQMTAQLYESLQAAVEDIDKHRLGLLPELEVYFSTYAGKPFVHLKEEAADGFRDCLDKSREMKVSSEWTELCAAHLDKIDPHTYPVVHEILPAGSPQQQEISFPGPAEKKEAGVKLSEKLLEFVQ